ncbi:MAG: hypothetical protein G01um10143_404 [Parcubacteria group bacterium Gr01-1014_3]|nr:MAG: hypothetical protein G01um10143_404 [Parcubacteria group bacterium Gr01-1014_3]
MPQIDSLNSWHLRAFVDLCCVKMKDFIIKIQNSSEQIRRFWLVVFSTLAMISTVSLWIVYINLTVQRVGPSPEQVAAQVIEEKASVSMRASFVDVFGAGLSKVIAQLQEALKSKRDIVIENPEIKFVSEAVEPIQTTKLP